MLDKVYNPKDFEKKWYDFWESNQFFHEEVDFNRKPYSIVIPPPNVTGQLHMGHAMDETLQDILIRFRRMQGYNTLWLPGCDHAGIATQAKVEASLREEGLTKYDLGREEFLKRTWAWKEKYGNRIMEQIRSLGSSCDWQRERFTMDEGCSKAVREVFVSLYEEGLIYKGTRITNWCPHCNTAISDIEVEHETEQGKLWHLQYHFVDDEEKFIEIATTRPETMLGDTGVAVHPDDERYKDFIGKEVWLPVVNRKIKIFADPYVDREFGTGAVKVTPAHDPNDFEMGLRHNLEQIKVINNDGTMADNTGKYAGMDRYECRRVLLQDLEKLGILVKTEDHEHAVGHCSRCHTTIEPLISDQWFMSMSELAKDALQVVLDGKIKFIPERFTKIYCNWLENIRDWCISRQLYWGHRIPAWYCDDCGKISVSREDLKVCPHCQSKNIHQDNDVLDTWFSSGLWPFSTMGFPNKTDELKHFYPTSTLVTGYDIIFFWVARMVVFGLKFAGDIPFRNVFIHGLLRDSQGRKMSKSLGNGIDPVEIIDKYGADALRFMLVTGNTPGNDLRFYWERVEGMKNFANKLWNASRFVLMNLENFDLDFVPEKENFTLADKWILSRFNQTAKEITENLEKFELGEAARSIYDFVWSEFCDWYIELAKGRLYSKEGTQEAELAKKTVQFILYEVLDGTLKLLHPFMPFITEEIWQQLPKKAQGTVTIMKQDWIAGDAEKIDEASEKLMTSMMNVIKSIRNMRAEVQVPPSKKVEAILFFKEKNLKDVFANHQPYVLSLANVEKLELAETSEKNQFDLENALTSVSDGIEIYLPLKSLLDIQKELARLQKEHEALQNDVTRTEKKLENKNFVAKAPADVVEKERKKLFDAKEKLVVLEKRLNDLKKL